MPCPVDRFASFRPIFFRLTVFLGIVWLCMACHTTPEERGAALAETRCGSCHLMPTPDRLTKKDWETLVLPNMAARLGLRLGLYNPYEGLNMSDEFLVRDAGAYPEHPQVSEEEWMAIYAYYTEQAPDSLPAIAPLPEADSADLPFDLHRLSVPNEVMPLVTMTAFHQQQLYIGTQSGYLYRFDSALRPSDAALIGTPPVAIAHTADQKGYLLGIGDLFPTEQANGLLFEFDESKGRFQFRATRGQLKRPVALAANSEQVWVGEFGYYTGQLMRQQGTQWEGITAQPGNRRIIPLDWDGNGTTDWLVLTAQGDEGVWVWLGQPDGAVRGRRLLRFSPIAGSTWLETADFDQDGRPDLLLTQGDNADYSYVTKPYHGVRIFLNRGGDQLEEAWFGQLPGAGMAKAADFDLDGDLDIVATAFFPDFSENKPNTFVYWENHSTGKDLSFSPRTWPQLRQGRWICFDTGDYDADGDADIVLGSFFYSPTQVPTDWQQRWQQSPEKVWVLENRAK